MPKHLESDSITPIHFVDLFQENKLIQEEYLSHVKDAIEGSKFVQGKEVKDFEDSFAQLMNSNYAVSCGSGLDALEIALRSLELPSDAEVILPSHTFIATLFAVQKAGLKPVLAEVESDTGNLDPTELERKWTSKTQVILPVHIYGQPASMKPIMEFAKQHKLTVIEDAAQAHGAKLDDTHLAGTRGKIGCFSFYPAKNLGAFGQAGGLLTQDKDHYEKLCAIRELGMTEKNKHTYIGLNSRMDPLQAIALRLKSRNLAQMNENRKKIANQYIHRLKEIGELRLPIPKLGNDHIYHLFVIRLSKQKIRDELNSYLKSKQIHCGIHYPIPMHLQESMKFLGYKKGDFPIAESFAETSLSLPMHPFLAEVSVNRICSEISEFFRCR